MCSRLSHLATTGQVQVEYEPEGLQAVFVMEVGDEESRARLPDVLTRPGPDLHVVPLSEGKITSFAVQAKTEDQALLDDIECLLRDRFSFLVIHRSFDPMIYGVVNSLCEDNESRLLTIPHCHICELPQAFPELVISTTDAKGEDDVCQYCPSCATRAIYTVISTLISAVRRYHNHPQISA